MNFEFVIVVDGLFVDFFGWIRLEEAGGSVQCQFSGNSGDFRWIFGGFSCGMPILGGNLVIFGGFLVDFDVECQI